MIYKKLTSLLLIILCSCSLQDSKIDLVVYPEYCVGCVIKNFQAIKNNSLDEKFNIYFDTTDKFILDAANSNGLEYNYIENEKIALHYGDYANIVLFKKNEAPIELKTNEKIKKGKHF